MHRSLLRKKEELKLAGKVKTLCEEKINPIIENLGYEVVEVEYAKKSDGMNLIFYIDKDEGVDIKDCELVSKAIDETLEQLNPTEDKPYILSVSSPGIDRPLKNDRDFERNKGKEISVTLFAKKDGKKEFKGQLEEYDNESLTILVGEQKIKFDKKDVAHIVPVIKF